MLDRNYADWARFIDSLLSANYKETVDTMEELNRLLLNYLTFAYSIQEHFQVSLRQRFKRDAAKLAAYDGFLDRLCAASWPVAFILDFRGYVQHVGLGITHLSRRANKTSVNLRLRGADVFQRGHERESGGQPWAFDPNEPAAINQVAKSS